MNKSACELMKEVAIVSAALIIAGSMFVLLAPVMSLQSILPVVFTYLGFFSVLVGVLVMVGLVAAVMLPKVSRQLETCQH